MASSTPSSYHDVASDVPHSHSQSLTPPHFPSTPTTTRRTVSVSAESFEAVITLLRDTFEESGTPVDEVWLRGVAQRTLRRSFTSFAQEELLSEHGVMGSAPSLPADQEGLNHPRSERRLAAGRQSPIAPAPDAPPAAPPAAPPPPRTPSRSPSDVGGNFAAPPTPVREALAALCRNAGRAPSAAEDSSSTDPASTPRWVRHGFTFSIPPPDPRLAEMDHMRFRALEASLDTLAAPYPPALRPAPVHPFVGAARALLAQASDLATTPVDLASARALTLLLLDILVVSAMFAPAFGEISHLPSFLALFPIPLLMWLRHFDSGIDAGGLAVLSVITCVEVLALVVVGAGARAWNVRIGPGTQLGAASAPAAAAFRMVAAGYAMHTFLFILVHVAKYVLYRAPKRRQSHYNSTVFAGKPPAHRVFSALLTPVRVVANALLLAGSMEGFMWQCIIGALTAAAAAQSLAGPYAPTKLALLYTAVTLDVAVATLRRVTDVLRAETAQRRADAMSNLSRVFHRVANDLEQLNLDAFEEQVERVYAVIAALPPDEQRLYVDEVVDTTQLPILKILVEALLEAAAANKRRLEADPKHLRSIEAGLFIECAVDVHRRFGHLRRRLYRLSPDIRRQADLDLRPWINWADEWETSWSIYEKCRLDFIHLQRQAEDACGVRLDPADGTYYNMAKAALEPLTLLAEPQYPFLPSPFDRTEKPKAYTDRIQRAVDRWTALTVTVLVVAIVLFVLQFVPAHAVWPSTYLWVSLLIGVATVFLLWRLLYVNYSRAKLFLVEVFLYGAFHCALFELVSALLLLCFVVLLRGLGNAIVADTYLRGIEDMADAFAVLVAGNNSAAAARLAPPLAALGIVPPFSAWYKSYTPGKEVYTYAAQAVSRAASLAGVSVDAALQPLFDNGDIGAFAHAITQARVALDSGTHVLFPCAGVALLLMGLRSLVLLGPRWPAGLTALAGMVVACAGAAALRNSGKGSARLLARQRLLPTLFAIFLAVVAYYGYRRWVAYRYEERAARLERARERAQHTSSA